MRITAICAVLLTISSAHADPGFDTFLQSTFADAEKLGVSRESFDAAIKGLEPDLSLPDLEIPGRKEPAPPQAEFVQTPAQYLKESNFSRLAAQGQKLAKQHKDTLARIEKEIGVPGHIVLGIWGRETGYGGYKLPHDAVRALATQAYTGRRKDMFREEFLYALKMLHDGIPREKMRSSWGGAIGLVQLLPSEYYKYNIDFDGDGKFDIWASVPDALAAAARQLTVKGWRRGEPWAVEVRRPKDADCTLAEPAHRTTIGEWMKRGYAPAYGRKLSDAELALEASLLEPEGAYGPAFLTPKNYFVIKDYNPSDLYVLYVGHLADRIAGGKPFEGAWAKTAQLRTADVEAMQGKLAAAGLYKDRVDGKAGMLTRAALGAYQKANNLKVDCWPTEELLKAMK